MSEPTFPRTFVVQRDEDVSGISGEGIVAEGCQFSDGWAVTHWLDQPPMNEPKTDVWHNKGSAPFERVHGHGGTTRILWADEVAALRSQFVSEVLGAYNVPPAILGADTEREHTAELIRRALLESSNEATQQWDRREYTVTGLLSDFANAVMPIVSKLMEQRDQVLATNGRAFGLARTWRRADEFATFPVRDAGAELRNVLSGVTEPDSGHACRHMETRTCPESYNGPCGDRPCARFESDDPAPWTDGEDPSAGGQTTAPDRCPLCPVTVPLSNPEQATAHFRAQHPEQRLVGPGPWPRLATDDEAGCEHRNPHPGFTCPEVNASQPYFDVRWEHERPTAPEAMVLRRRITRAVQAVQDGQAAPVEVGDERIIDAVMPTVADLLEQRDQWRNGVGRAYHLAYTWQGAHGSANFLVRAAGVELRDALDDSRPDGTTWCDGAETRATECSAQYHGHQTPRQCIRAGQHRGDHIDDRGFHWSDTVAVYPVIDGEVQYRRAQTSSCTNPDHACGTCGNCVNDHSGEGGCSDSDQLPPNQGPLTGIEVRDRCPYCESHPLIPRLLMADHIQDNHPGVTLATHENADGAADLGHAGDLSEMERLRAEIAQLHEGEDQHTDERVVPTPAQWIWRWNRATPARRLKVAAQVVEAQDRSFACLMEDHRGEIEELRTGSAATGSQACPYCSGAPLFPRHELGAHIQQQHARIVNLLASGASLDEQLADPETRCRLPHEMEA